MDGNQSTKGQASEQLFDDLSLNLSEVFDTLRQDSNIAGMLEEDDDWGTLLQEEINTNYQLLDNDLSEHPYKEEQEKLQTIEKLDEGSTNLINEELLSYLSEVYSKQELNTKFFCYKLKQLENMSDTPRVLTQTAMRNELVRRWKGLLEQKVDSWKMKQIDQWRDELLERLKDKMDEISELKKALSLDEPGKLWNMAQGKWRDMDFELLEEYQEILEDDRSLQAIIEIIGRGIAADEEEHEEDMKDSSKQVEVADQHGKEEFVSVKESNDLNYMLSSETALLTDENLQTLFHFKFVEQKLLTYDLIARQKADITDEESTTQEKISQKGPIIVCVDTSGSMKGTPEKIAKTLSYACCRLAITEERNCHIIAFSTDTRTFTVESMTDLPDLVNFLQYSFHGGTSFASPMTKACQLVRQENNWTKADILIISDFVLASLDNYTAASIAELQDQELLLHSLIISSSGNENILENFDYNWRYNPDEDQSLTSIGEAGPQI